MSLSSASQNFWNAPDDPMFVRESTESVSISITDNGNYVRLIAGLSKKMSYQVFGSLTVQRRNTNNDDQEIDLLRLMHRPRLVRE